MPTRIIQLPLYLHTHLKINCKIDASDRPAENAMFSKCEHTRTQARTHMYTFHARKARIQPKTTLPNYAAPPARTLLVLIYSSL